MNLTDVLCFYGAESNWQERGWQGDPSPSPVTQDRGSKARNGYFWLVSNSREEDIIEYARHATATMMRERGAYAMAYEIMIGERDYLGEVQACKNAINLFYSKLLSGIEPENFLMKEKFHENR